MKLCMTTEPEKSGRRVLSGEVNGVYPPFLRQAEELALELTWIQIVEEQSEG